MSYISQFTKGIIKENPVFRILLGMCPTLATSTSVINALGMGIAATFVLTCSNIIISSIRKIVPDKIRIPVFIIVIATFTTIVDLMMAAFTPDLHKVLGIFIPLIVVNCIILGRAEAFASKNSIIDSTLDGLGMGAGFTLALAMLGTVREILGAGTFLGIPLFGPNFQPVLVMILPPGAFIALGLFIALMNLLQKKAKTA
jgi:Na+-translocating ferredoxin:NAD+ oxidoreductase subunit E